MDRRLVLGYGGAVSSKAALIDIAARGEGTTMGNRVLGILVFVGILAVVNVLSYLLDWGFWLY